MKTLKVNLKTLTPLWTGDAWREGKELKLTGIIGSLRWWFEALVRGMGYKACDSTSENKCKVEVKNVNDFLDIQKKICPVCFLFGTTGWKSRFSVEVGENNLQMLYNGKVVVKINGGRGWHYEAGLMGDAELAFKYDDITLGEKDNKIISLGDVLPSILKILLSLIGNHGMLGAKTAMGYGVVEFKIDNSELSVSDEDWENFKTYLSFFNSKFREGIKNLPNLKNFFFVKFRVNDSIDNVIKNVKPFFSYQDGIIETDTISKWKDKNWCITSPVVRKCLRCIFRGQYSDKVCWLNRGCSRNYWRNYYGENNTRNKEKNNNYDSSITIDNLGIGKNHTQKIRHFLMGSTKEPEFSAIQVSHVYRNGEDLEFRIYGWLPDNYSLKGKVSDIIELLQKIFSDIPWKERDNKDKKEKFSLLPSRILENICWNSSSLSLINSDERIERLLNSSKSK